MLSKLVLELRLAFSAAQLRHLINVSTYARRFLAPCSYLCSPQAEGCGAAANTNNRRITDRKLEVLNRMLESVKES